MENESNNMGSQNLTRLESQHGGEAEVNRMCSSLAAVVIPNAVHFGANRLLGLLKMALRFAVSLARSLKANLLLLYVRKLIPPARRLGPCHLRSWNRICPSGQTGWLS